MSSAEQGSPPLTRGKAKPSPPELLSRRITPAYAGKRRFADTGRSKKEDHPRLRGEKLNGQKSGYFRQGSPPLTRGKVSDIAYNERRERITPAYAGKSGSGSIYTKSGTDHPRLRGEKISMLSHWILFAGSPPLTRGKAIAWRLISECVRITTAYAGKSRGARTPGRPAEDHPRLRGEKLLHMLECVAVKGSPPLTRGKVQSALHPNG